MLAAFVIMGRGLGASGAFSTVVAVGVNEVAPSQTADNSFYQGYLGDGTQSPFKSWLVFEVIGVVIGGLISGSLAGRIKKTVEKGDRITTTKRLLYAFTGGTLMGIGAKLARGCTSGQALTGGALLSRRLGVHAYGICRGIRNGIFRKEAVDIMAPFYKFGFFNDQVSLIIAVVIGIGFGFFLERAGFGSARKLAAQFYFTDMAVFKVMFTAIVTAMLGLFYFSWLGWIDLSQVYIGNTYIAPMLLGGFILGVGFVIGGYCPGTSAVACSTGKIDGYVFLFGVLFGIFVFGELFPWISDFYNSTPMGRITLPELFNISFGTIVFFVVLIAVGGFIGAEKVEKLMAKKYAEK